VGSSGISGNVGRSGGVNVVKWKGDCRFLDFCVEPRSSTVPFSSRLAWYRDCKDRLNACE